MAAARTASAGVVPSANCVTRPGDPSPRPSTTAASTTTSTSPDSSIAVIATFARSDSLMLRALSAATTARNSTATRRSGASTNVAK
ncbi:Uncharacterised protein [Mycobacteroides abscessus]|nr:Uncharacterised protein [Mycobacteroides abscessus]